MDLEQHVTCTIVQGIVVICIVKARSQPRPCPSNGKERREDVKEKYPVS